MKHSTDTTAVKEATATNAAAGPPPTLQTAVTSSTRQVHEPSKDQKSSKSTNSKRSSSKYSSTKGHSNKEKTPATPSSSKSKAELSKPDKTTTSSTTSKASSKGENESKAATANEQNAHVSAIADEGQQRHDGETDLRNAKELFNPFQFFQQLTHPANINAPAQLQLALLHMMHNHQKAMAETVGNGTPKAEATETVDEGKAIAAEEQGPKGTETNEHIVSEAEEPKAAKAEDNVEDKVEQQQIKMEDKACQTVKPEKKKNKKKPNKPKPQDAKASEDVQIVAERRGEPASHARQALPFPPLRSVPPPVARSIPVVTRPRTPPLIPSYAPPPPPSHHLGQGGMKDDWRDRRRHRSPHRPPYRPPPPVTTHSHRYPKGTSSRTGHSDRYQEHHYRTTPSSSSSLSYEGRRENYYQNRKQDLIDRYELERLNRHYNKY